MPIDMNDPYGGGQQDIPLGQSTLPIRETYSAAPNAINAAYADKMHKVSELVHAVSSLSSTFKEQEAKQQAVNNQAAMIQAHSVDAGNTAIARGGPGGVMGTLFSSGGATLGDASTQMKIAEMKGSEAAIKAISEDPNIIALRSNEDLKTRPAEYNAAMDAAIKANREKFASTNPYSGAVAPMFLGGFDSTMQKLREHGSEEALKAAIEQVKKDRDTAAQHHMNLSQPLTNTQSAAFKGVADAGGDPIKFQQYVAIENPKWDNNDTSSAGAKGLTQITDGRWATIKQSIAKTNPEVAAQLTNPRDPYQNSLAWAYEYKNDFAKAQAVLGREPTTAETYMFWIHPATATAMLTNPNAKVADIVPANVIAANPAVYGNGSGTAAETIARVNQKMNAGSGFHTQFHPANTVPQQMLTRDTWNDNATQWKYKWTDFKNSGEYGGDGQLNSRSVYLLDQLSSHLGRKIEVTSAFRSEAYNVAVTGTTTHNHPSGDALDVAIKDPQEQLKAATFLASMGARGIGVYNGHIHFDLATGRPNQAKLVNTWSKSGAVSDDALRNAVDAGLQQRGNGNYYRVAGYQGQPPNPTEVQIQTLSRTYGVSPARAREIVFSSTIDSAQSKALRGDAAGAQRDLANFSNTWTAKSDADQLKIDQTSEKVDAISRANRDKREKEQEAAAHEAQDAFIKKAVERYKADPKATPLVPRREDFPATRQGQEAYDKSIASSVNIPHVPNEASAGVLLHVGSQIAADPMKFAKEIGFKGDLSKATPNEILPLLSQRYRGEMHMADIQNAAAAFEKARVGLPIAQTAAKSAAELNKVEIAQAFKAQTGAVQAIAQYAKTFGGLNEVESGNRMMADNIEVLSQYYQKVYSELYRQTAANLPGAPDGQTLQNLHDRAMQLTTIMAKSMGDEIAGAKGVPADYLPQHTQLQKPNPQDFNTALKQATVVADPNGGYVVKDIQWPGIPPGAQVMTTPQVGKDGKVTGVVPRTTPDGSYMMLTPNMEVFYYKPQFNVLPEAQYPPPVTGLDVTEPVKFSSGQPPKEAPQDNKQLPLQNITGLNLGPQVQKFIEETIVNWLKNNMANQSNNKK